MYIAVMYIHCCFLLNRSTVYLKSVENLSLYIGMIHSTYCNQIFLHYCILYANLDLFCNISEILLSAIQLYEHWFWLIQHCSQCPWVNSWTHFLPIFCQNHFRYTSKGYPFFWRENLHNISNILYEKLQYFSSLYLWGNFTFHIFMSV